MKRTHYLTCLLLATLVLSSMPVFAQFTLDAQLRPRFEFRDGYQQMLPVGSVPTAMISQRSRFGFTYQTGNLKLKFVPQDVRIWGDEQIANTTGVFGDHASLDVHEAYAEFAIKPHLWISVGRQELVYDNMSLLSNRNWNQHGIASDAVVLKTARRGWNAHLGGTWNTLKESSSNNLYPTNRLKTLSYLWLNKRLKNGIQLSLVHVASGITETDTTNTLRFRQTSGIYAQYQKRHFNVKGDLYYQYGKNQQGIPVSAFMADADVSRRFGILTAGIGLGFVSGNRSLPEDLNTDHSFYELYRAKHLFFGFMDYFTNVPLQNKQGGLVDYFYYVDLKISQRLSIKQITHYFMLAQTNPLTPKKRHLGTENDLILSYRFADWGTLEAGYLFMISTESLNQLQGVNNPKFPQFGYVMLNITPVMLRQ